MVPFLLESDWMVCALLIVVSLIVRIPFLKYCDLVSFDGTYYINQARTFWSNVPQPGAFPIGYPFFISLFLPVVRDGVRAAQVVSFLASLGSLIVFFHLAKRYLERQLAFYCSLCLALMPLFIRLSLVTFSEQIYLFWVLMMLLFFSRRKDVSTGFAAGAAAITRPEIIGVVALLSLMRLKTPRRMFIILGCFAFVYSLNVLKFYQANGSLMILPKSGFFGAIAQEWQEREMFLDTKSAAEPGQEISSNSEMALGKIISAYFRRMPREIYTLASHVAYIMLLMAIYGFYKRPNFLLAALVPFFIGPIFTVRVMDRYLLPYLPIIILYAFVGADAIKKKHARKVAFSALAIAVLLGIILNYRILVRPVDEGYSESKKAGLFLKNLAREGDKVAGRKPYVAFYSQCGYLAIPLDDYERTFDYLDQNDVRFLSLHYSTIKQLRPFLLPLLTDYPVILGELRLDQIYFSPDGIAIYERTMDESPLIWKRITNPASGKDASPDWSPDGTTIAFSSTQRGSSDIYRTSIGDEREMQIVVEGPGEDVHPDWSPDGTQIVFSSNRSGSWDLFTINVATGALKRLTDATGVDRAPRWTPDGKYIIFSSIRTGSYEIWSLNMSDGSMNQLTTGGLNNYPSISPDGSRIAFTRREKELVILDLRTGKRIIAKSPRDVNYAPAWSPDGRSLAVSGKDWGSIDIYLVTADGGQSILLTRNITIDKDRSFDAMPSWSPDGHRLAIASSRNGVQSIYVLEGFTPFIDRMSNPPRFFVFNGKKDPQ